MILAGGTPFAQSFWAWLIGIVVGTGIVGGIWKLFARVIPPRPVFGVGTDIDKNGTVAIDIVQQSATPGYITAIEIVAVRPVAYWVVRWLLKRTGVAIQNSIVKSVRLPDNLAAMTQNQPLPRQFVNLPPKPVLPQRWHPLRDPVPRAWFRAELRLSVTSSRARFLRFGNTKFRYNKRLNYVRGPIEIKTAGASL